MSDALNHEVISLTTLESDLRKAVQSMAFNLEHKQFTNCGIAIGQIRMIGEAIKSHSFALEAVIVREEMKK